MSEMESVWKIEPIQPGFVANAAEIWRYRRLLRFFGIRAVRDRYEKTTLGVFWLFARPLLPLVISVAIFGGLLDLPSDGVPYLMFFLTGNSVWLIFQRGLLRVTLSMDSQASLMKKIYFPRLIVPLSSIAPALVEAAIYFGMILVAAVFFFWRDGQWYLRMSPVGWLAAALAVVLAMVMAIAMGLVTTVLQTRHAEVRFTISYITGFWMYLTPIIYPMSRVPPKLHWVMYINPMASVVETFKWGVLGIGTFPQWPLISSTVALCAGTALAVIYFTRSEVAAVDDM